jgi:site-specific DNA-methyltransferase (adenine-specific)
VADRQQRPDKGARGTSTSNFGVSKRESHDATGFYNRFVPPVVDKGGAPRGRRDLDDIYCGDARDMAKVDDDSVALVVTSPPYFAGKAYEEALDEEHIPATYLEYLDMLEAVFAECVRTLEPGGRIAVNVANLGRKPYRSLSSDVIDILEKRLRLLLRGEVLWVKARGSAGNCAWGSFQKPANPVLRDLTERVIIASKGRFDRALSAKERAKRGLPSEASMWRDEFMEATTDIWEIPPESASRVNHPAPFPVDLPKRLIHLYTYREDLVLDPFMGSGTTAVAAVRSGRHFVGYDMDQAYVDAALARVEAERERLPTVDHAFDLDRFALPATPGPAPDGEDFQSRAVREGRASKEVARAALDQVGFTDIQEDVKVGGGVEVNFKAWDAAGRVWYFDVSGGFTSNRPGLKRTDTLWKAIGKASVLHAMRQPASTERLVLLTTDVPEPGSAGALALKQVCGDDKPIQAVLRMMSAEDLVRLAEMAAGSLDR